MKVVAEVKPLPKQPPWQPALFLLSMIFRVVKPGQFLEIKAFGNGPTRMWFLPLEKWKERLVKLWPEIEKCNRAGWEIAFGPNARVRERGRAEDVEQYQTLWVDIDHPPEDAVQKLAALEKRGVVSSSQLFSGHGVHAYFILADPVDPQVGRDLCRRLARELDGDLKAIDPARVLRLPGTMNNKDPEKPAVTGMIGPVRAHRYRPAYLEKQLPLPLDRTAAGGEARPATRAPGRESAPKAGVRLDAEAISELSDRARSLFVKGKRHEAALALAAHAARAGIAEDSCLAVVEAICHENGDQDELGDRLKAVRHTYQRAASGRTISGEVSDGSGTHFETYSAAAVLSSRVRFAREVDYDGLVDQITVLPEIVGDPILTKLAQTLDRRVEVVRRDATRARRRRSDARKAAEPSARREEVCPEEWLGKHLPNLEVLGEDGDRVWLRGRDRRIVRKYEVRKIERADLTLVAGEEAPRLLDTTPMSDVRDRIALVARSKHIDAERVFGQGVWSTGRCIIIVSGSRCMKVGPRGLEEASDSDLNGNLVLGVQGREWIDVDRVSARMLEIGAEDRVGLIERFRKFLENWTWALRPAPLLLTGQIIAAVGQTLWPWKSNIWLTGRRASGKTILLKSLESVFGPLALLREGDLTSAALRQELESDARLILFDEFEPSNKSRAVMELLRSACRGGVVSRGSPSGRVIRFVMRSMAIVGSIRSDLLKAADASRFLQLEVIPCPKPASPRVELGDVESLRVDMFSSALSVLEPALELFNGISLTPIDGADSRLVEGLAVPAAMLTALMGGTAGDAEKLLREWAADFASLDAAVVEDEEALLRALLDAHVIATIPARDREKRTVGQIVNNSVLLIANKDLLEGYGVKVIDGRRLFIDQEPAQRHLLAGTPWQNGRLDELLLRLPGAKRDRRRLAGDLRRGLCVPLPLLDDPEDEPEDELEGEA